MESFRRGFPKSSSAAVEDSMGLSAQPFPLLAPGCTPSFFLLHTPPSMASKCLHLQSSASWTRNAYTRELRSSVSAVMYHLSRAHMVTKPWDLAWS